MAGIQLSKCQNKVTFLLQEWRRWGEGVPQLSFSSGQNVRRENKHRDEYRLKVQYVILHLVQPQGLHFLSLINDMRLESVDQTQSRNSSTFSLKSSSHTSPSARIHLTSCWVKAAARTLRKPDYVWDNAPNEASVRVHWSALRAAETAAGANMADLCFCTCRGPRSPSGPIVQLPSSPAATRLVGSEVSLFS